MLAESYLRSGKVRDLYELPDGRLLLVASDRISRLRCRAAVDDPRQGAGPDRAVAVLVRGDRRHRPEPPARHGPEALVDAYQAEFERHGLPAAISARLDDLRGRVMICRSAWVIPVEAVVRGYLAGSGWKEYQANGTVCGIPLPPGLRESDRLPEPIFTPATKAELGEHDENISFDAMIEHIVAEGIAGAQSAGPLAEAIRDRALRLYRLWRGGRGAARDPACRHEVRVRPRGHAAAAVGSGSPGGVDRRA